MIDNDEYYPCDDCEETDTWECSVCSLYADYIGDEDFDAFDI
nr:MAG TPA: GTP-binding nuclear protein [Caudoviricetes sp.]